MESKNLAKVAALLLGAALAGCGGQPSSATERGLPAAVTSNGVTATLAVQSDWGAGYCANVTLSNGSASTATSWTVVLALANSTLSQAWGVTSSVNGSLVTITPTAQNSGIAPNASVNFGFCATASGSPHGATIESLQVTGGGSGSSSGGSSSSSGSSSSGASGYSLTIGVSGNGTTNPPPGTYYHSPGIPTQVTATAASGHTFTGWSGAATGTANPVTLTVNSNKTLTASFSPSATTQSVLINAGGAASGSFLADTYYSGGSTYSNRNTTDTSLLSGTVPPQAVFQTERHGEFTYTIPNLTPGSAQTVTLYFQESYWTAAGQRTFDVAVNGTKVLTAFDIYAAAGGTNKAVARAFDTTASASGQVVIQFTKGGGPDNPKVCGLAVAGGGTGPTTYALTVSRIGTGSGTVSGGGISCGSTCTASYTPGTTVTLSAAAASGSVFAGWGGACGGTGTCTVTLNAAQTVTASFTSQNPTSKYVVAMVQASKAQATDLTTADVASLVQSAVTQAGGLDFIQNGQTVVLKPNLLTAYTDAMKASPASSTVNGIDTDWRVVKAVADLVRARNPSGKILVMEGSVNSTARAFSMLGYTAANFGSSVDEFIALEGSSCADRTTGALEQRTAASGKKYWINSRYVKADVVISLPTMKTHAQAGITGAVKNLGIGVTPVGQYSAGTNASDDCTRGQSATYIDHSTPEALGAFIRDYYSLRPADFVVMDALQGLEWGPLPAWGGGSDYASARKNMRLVLAGKNAVALDTIASLVMACDPTKVPHLTKLAADGLGTTDVGAITLVGKQVSEVVTPFNGKQTAICPGKVSTPTRRPGGACQAGVSYPAPILGGTARLLYKPSGTVSSGTFEGPVWVSGSSSLLLSDISFTGSVNPSQLLRSTTTGSVTTLLADAGVNGMATDGAGSVYACSHKVQGIVKVNTSTGALTTLVDNIGGKKFNSPNDLVVRSDGTLYFTDPDFQLGNRTSQTGKKGVYRMSPSGTVSLVDDTFAEPNGIALSPDQGTLYVADYNGNVVRAFTVAADGSTSGRRSFATVSSPDGFGMDCLGNLYVASGSSGTVQVFSPAGQQLGSISVASSVSNVAFGGADGKTLFITAGKALYAFDMNLPGYLD